MPFIYVKNSCKKLIDPQMLENLQETIVLRENLGATYKEDTDNGHGFISFKSSCFAAMS